MPSLGSLVSGFGRLIGTLIAVVLIIGGLGAAGWYGYQNWMQGNGEPAGNGDSIANNQPGATDPAAPPGSGSGTSNEAAGEPDIPGDNGLATDTPPGSGTNSTDDPAAVVSSEKQVSAILDIDHKGPRGSRSFTVVPDATYYLAFNYNAIRRAPGVYATFGVKLQGSDLVLANESNADGNNDTTTIRLEPGTYTLDIRADNCTWGVKVIETKMVTVTAGDLAAAEAANAAAAAEAEQQRLAAEEQSRLEAEREQMIEAAKTRIWTTADGGFSVEAKFVTFIDGTVHLKRTDNDAVVKVPLTILSPGDQDFIKNRRWLE